jgi:hypothetical protein
LHTPCRWLLLSWLSCKLVHSLLLVHTSGCTRPTECARLPVSSRHICGLSKAAAAGSCPLPHAGDPSAEQLLSRHRATSPPEPPSSGHNRGRCPCSKANPLRNLSNLRRVVPGCNTYPAEMPARRAGRSPTDSDADPIYRLCIVSCGIFLADSVLHDSST